MATSPYRYYLDVISNWHTAIAVENQWFVWIDLPSVGALKNNISNLVNSYDVGSGNLGWNIPNSTINKLISKENQDGEESLIGCVFATSVRIPSERVDIKNIGLSYGGYQAPATANTRDSYKELTISFMETNSSFIDFIIRPWIVSVGYFGLIARDKDSEKKVAADYLDVVYIGRTGPYSPSIKRKIIRFFGVVPKNVDGASNQYASLGASLNISVTFAYDYYTVIDPSGGSSGNSNPAANNTANNTANVNVQPINQPNPVQYQNPNITNPLQYNQPFSLPTNLTSTSVTPQGNIYINEVTGSNPFNNPFNTINLNR